MDIIGNITWLGGRVAAVPSERIVKVITNVIKGKEGIEMAETIQRGIFQQGITEGIAIGEAKGKAEGVVMGEIRAILRLRFKEVPQEIKEAIQSMTDLVALQSLLTHAESCGSLDEFAEALK